MGSLSYSVTVDHSGRILSVMGSNYGTRNDKTIVHRDAYITDIHDGIENKDLEYKLYVDGVLTIQRGHIIYVMGAVIIGDI